MSRRRSLLCRIKGRKSLLDRIKILFRRRCPTSSRKAQSHLKVKMILGLIRQRVSSNRHVQQLAQSTFRTLRSLLPCLTAQFRLRTTELILQVSLKFCNCCNSFGSANTRKQKPEIHEDDPGPRFVAAATRVRVLTAAVDAAFRFAPDVESEESDDRRAQTRVFT